jgi:hypothetical protein
MPNANVLFNSNGRLRWGRDWRQAGKFVEKVGIQAKVSIQFLVGFPVILLDPWSSLINSLVPNVPMPRLVWLKNRLP